MSPYMSFVVVVVVVVVVDVVVVVLAYPHVGCYEGWRIRRYYNHDLGFWRGDDAVMQCYLAARKDKYKSFAITEGKCLSGSDAEKHYTSFDKSDRCNSKGTGGKNLYDIYLVQGRSRDT